MYAHLMVMYFAKLKIFKCLTCHGVAIVLSYIYWKWFLQATAISKWIGYFLKWIGGSSVPIEIGRHIGH